MKDGGGSGPSVRLRVQFVEHLGDLMSHAPYGYVRSLEVEGRHPHDVGQWGVTSMRLNYLEGLPLDLEENMVPVEPDGTFPPTPAGLHRVYYGIRTRYYRRVRLAAEAAAVLDRRGIDGLTKACLPLYPSWIDPPEGVIPMPAPGERPAPETHAVRLIDYYSVEGTTVAGEADAKHFLFENSWGEGWGKDGFALLPFAYYDTYGFEQWSEYRLPAVNNTFLKVHPGLTLFKHRWLRKGLGAWQARDEFDRRVYAFEAGDPDGERHGWAFAIEGSHAIELEELYVAPHARTKGIGSELALLVSGLAKAKGLPLRVWIGFADTVQESPHTARSLPALARKLEVSFHPCPVPWAAYFATSEAPGSSVPVEPRSMPSRPKSTMGALAAFALSVGLPAAAIDEPGLSPAAATTLIRPAVTSLDSPEWDALNGRRMQLIRKKNREGLGPDEQAEFEWLQATARRLVEAVQPRPELLAPSLQALLDSKAAR